MKRSLHHILLSFSFLVWTSSQTIAADTNSFSLKYLAGDYYYGDGLGTKCSLALTEQGDFTFEWRGCLGIYNENNGSASIHDGVLHIAPKKPNVRKGPLGTPTEFFPVRWGARLYLIPTNEIVAFCSAVNQGDEPRHDSHGWYYLRQNDWDKPVTGMPKVPSPWAKYLLSEPIKGKITKLDGKQSAWLDVGSDSGLLEGMILTAQDHGKLMFARVRVRCRIKCEWKDSELSVGQTVSSRFQEPTTD
jgi:hypothetical protein